MGSAGAEAQQGLPRDCQAIPRGAVPQGRRVGLGKSELLPNFSTLQLPQLTMSMWQILGDSSRV